jgi:hypothetical protein
MLKAAFFCFCWTLAGIVIISQAASGEDAGDQMCIPMGIITIRAPEGVEPQRAPVDFPHAVHFSYACQECHHTWEGEAPIAGCQTSGCHDGTVSPQKATNASEADEMAVRYYKYAYHDMCIGCHKAIKKTAQELEASTRTLETVVPASGPTGCVECHPRE